MTTKIQNIAMFAIAAFALGGMMVTPAFAASTDINTTVTANSGIADSGYTTKACGFGTDCESKVKSSTTSNWVKIYYGVDSGAECDTVDLEVKVNGNSVGSTTRSDVSGSGNFIKWNTSVSSGDTIAGYATFTDCI